MTRLLYFSVTTTVMSVTPWRTGPANRWVLIAE